MITGGPVSPARDQLNRVIAVVKRAVRRWWIVGIFAVIGGGIAAGIAIVRPRKYTSETVLLYREGVERSYIQGNDAARADAADEGMRLREMMLARSRLQQVIEEFGLVPRIVQKFGYVEAVEEVRKEIDFRMRGGDTIHIAFSGSDPDTAQKVCARLADILIEENARLQIEQAEGTKSFLETTKKRAQDEMQEKQRSYSEFLARHPEFAQDTIVTTGAAGAAVLAARRRSGGENGPKDPVVARLEAQRDRLRRLLSAKNGGAEPEDAGVQVDPALVGERQAAQDELTDAKRNLAERAQQYTEAHPDVQAAKRRVAAAEERTRRAREAVFAAEAVRAGWKKIDPSSVDKAKVEKDLSEIEHDLSNARDRARSKGGEATAPDPNNKSYVSIVNIETEWARLNRELNDARERTDQLDTIEFRATMLATSVTSGNSSQMVVVNPAFKPLRPAGAGRTLITLVGLMVATALGSAFVLGLALLDDRFYESADVERAGVAPLLIAIPKRARWRRRG